MNRRSFVALIRAAILAATALAAGAATAQVQSYPNKPVRVIVPFAPGGGIDILIRAIGAELAQKWKQPVVVENRAGAGSLIGAEAVATAPADGYTLLATVNQTLVANRYLYKQLPYDPDRSFAPITMMVRSDQLILANANVPVKNFKELLALARRQPGKLTYGSFGNGSQPHLLFELVKNRESVDMLHVPYKGINPLLTALAAGEVMLATGSANVAAPLIAAGKIKPVSVAGKERVAQYPDVPTADEEGYPYVRASIWYGLFAPAGTPQPVLDKIRDDIRAILKQPDFAEKQATSKGLTVIASDGARLRQEIREEAAIVGDMVKAAGVQPE
ncbi:tripartite tricarboxylate transporter substrate binding protein [Pigmentiphaga soli]|uniref:Tripartite tricarboxylate transporter substrate binding protein n=1 Tax=Pigmentiphaga soli TaxID=1007095 RepID=A0ABP8GGK1_9BURK